ncbi:MAG: lysostaphin resistance A-like protein [Acidimicrobiales bacterium]|nr:CPBP family intramembrane metalloprotease [Actinomycetota bacterium]
MSPEEELQPVEATGVPPQPRWGLGDAAAGFLIGFVLSSFAASVWLAGTGGRELSIGGQALAQVGLWVGLAGSAVLAARRKGSGSIGVDFGFRARGTDIPLGAVVGLLGQAALVPAVAFLLRPLLGRPDVDGPVEDLFESAHGVGLVGVVLFAVVGAAIVEELFFRGLLLRSLQRRLGTGGAVAVSAGLFGLSHPQPLPAEGQILVMVSLTALGVVLAALAVRTGRLGPPIVAHAAFNAWTAAILLSS